jgi:hypothetical protein
LKGEEVMNAVISKPETNAAIIWVAVLGIYAITVSVGSPIEYPAISWAAVRENVQEVLSSIPANLGAPNSILLPACLPQEENEEIPNAERGLSDDCFE